jgi:hypothetical protein
MEWTNRKYLKIEKKKIIVLLVYNHNLLYEFNGKSTIGSLLMVDNLGEIFSDIDGNLFVQNSNGTFVQIFFDVDSVCLAVKNDEVDKDDEHSVASVFDGMVDEDEMDDEDDEDDKDKDDEDNDEFSIASVFDGMITLNNPNKMENSDDDEEDD